MNTYHIPVMLREVMALLDVQKKAWYIDCNLGGGGHTDEILRQGGKVLGIYLEQDAIIEVAGRHHLEIVTKDEHIEAVSQNLILIQANFTNLKEVAKHFRIPGVKGVLFDLGVSSHQLETPERGFSFNQGGNLDMRMDQASGVRASDLINGLH